MKKFYLGLLVVFLVSCLSGLPQASAQEVIERIPSGVINWSQGLVTAKGSGAPPSGVTVLSQARLMAERAARADALRNLLEAVKGVRVDSETTVETYTTKSDRVFTRVSGIVIGARVVETRYMSDGAVEITMAINLTGELLAVMLQEIPPLTRAVIPAPTPPPALKPTPPPKSTPPAPPEQKPILPVPPPLPPKKETKEPPPRETKATQVQEAPAKPDTKLDLKKVDYTGLIVDARKLGLRPALIPKILNERGELVYSTQSVDQKDLVKMGLVGYAKDVKAAARNQRVTADPYVVPGLTATGEKKTDVVISNRDAEIVQTTAPYTGYLKNGRVMVVYD